MTDSSFRPLRVFLCHSSGDKPTVRELYQRLEAEGWIDPWLDTEKLYPGQDWNFEIERAVEAADVILVCISKDSVTKEGYVQRELRTVLDLADYKPEGTVFVIPVRLEECDPPRRLRSWQYADFFPESERDQAYQRLLASLRIRAEKLDIDYKDSENRAKEKQIQDSPDVKTQLDILASQAIRYELMGELWNALQTYYKIKRIDPLFPRVDKKISQLEYEFDDVNQGLPAEWTESPSRNLRRIMRSLTLLLGSGIIITFVVLRFVVTIGIPVGGGGNAIPPQILMTGSVALLLGAVQAGILKSKIRSRLYIFIAVSLLGGLASGIVGGLLLNLGWHMPLIIGAINGLLAGGISSLAQNRLMGNKKYGTRWFLYNAISWTVIFSIAWIIFWSPIDITLVALAGGFLLVASGIVVLYFLRRTPQIEFS